MAGRQDLYGVSLIIGRCASALGGSRHREIIFMSKSLQAKGVVAALVLSLIARAGFAALLSTRFGRDPALVENLSGLLQYVFLSLLCLWLMHDASVYKGAVFGRAPDLGIVRAAVAFAVLLLAFEYGWNFMEVYVTAQWAPAFAYSYWHFHASHYVLTLSTASYLVLAANQFIAAPLVEELVFRGLLQRAWSASYGLRKAIVFVAMLFTLLHFSRHYYVGTFVFSVVLSLLYVKFRSLWVNVGVHALFNTLAFGMEFKVGFHWERPLTQLAEMEFWLPELAMLLVSLPLLAVFVRRNWRRLDLPLQAGN